MYLASDLEIFLSQIFIEPMGCWRWTGLRGNGYGFLNKKLAHRFAYETFVGPIPDGFETCHLCHNKDCVNPGHIQMLSRKENYAWKKKNRRHPIERFLARVSITDTGCWDWGRAYGSFKYEGCSVPAHRFAYEFFVGPILEGLEIDHLCRNPRCVNPDHLEAVTHAVNLQRGLSGILGRKRFCKRGHPLDERNTYIDPRRRRSCRKCGILRTTLWRKRKNVPHNL